MQDGQNLFDPATAFGGQDWRADVTADDLICRGEIEPVIMVGIYNTGVRRVSEYTPTRDRRLRKGGKAVRYTEMLAREIKPLIDHEYRTLKSARHTAVGGSSLGALASLIAALEYPRVFGQVAMLSPSVAGTGSPSSPRRALIDPDYGRASGWTWARRRVMPRSWRLRRRASCGTPWLKADGASEPISSTRKLKEPATMKPPGRRDSGRCSLIYSASGSN
ncbi:MAG: hypothetical protein LAP39_11210 [Acidobacteriia bacterium]|nr:hypothetical protein [Terriglobia bacterium]